MSDKTKDPVASRRRLFVRSGLVLAYVLLLGIVFVLGKGHSLLIDNKSLADGSAEAIDGVLVSIDGRESLELYSGDRDIALLKGQLHRVSVESVSGGDRIEKSFRLPMDADMLLLSIPKLVAGQEPFIEVFIQRDQPRPVGEEIGNTNAFTSPDDPEAIAPPATAP